jgi:hypothetical protein
MPFTASKSEQIRSVSKAGRKKLQENAFITDKSNFYEYYTTNKITNTFK